MIQKPAYLESENAEPFQDKSVVQAYRHRPPYPAEVFDILAGLINGNHPRLRWLCGRVEEVELNPPYALVTAGESLHWMDWNIVLPRFREALTKEGYLAIVKLDTMPGPWSTLREIIPRYRTNAGYQPYDMIEAFERYGLFQKVGERLTAPVPFVQSIDDYIESYHSRSGFSRERMGSVQAAAFDREARNILLRSYSEGMITFQVMGNIVWGFPSTRGRP